MSEDIDRAKLSISGHSKRSVKEAYNRAKQYKERVSKQPIIQKSDNDSVADV